MNHNREKSPWRRKRCLPSLTQPAGSRQVLGRNKKIKDKVYTFRQDYGMITRNGLSKIRIAGRSVCHDANQKRMDKVSPGGSVSAFDSRLYVQLW
jgi:hypothetical protein